MEIKRFLRTINKDLDNITTQDLRRYLLTFKDYSPATRANKLKALKLFFRDFLQKPNLVETFKFPRQFFKPKRIPTKENLRRFYRNLKSLKDRVLFLIYATTGLRRNEVLSLLVNDVNFEEKIVLPKQKANRTKHTWISFFNDELKQTLTKYLYTRKDSNPKLFPTARE